MIRIEDPCGWLQACGSCEKVIEMTLTLFKDLTAGYMSGKVLTKLESVSQLLTNHSPQQYAFLQTSPNSRNRTTFHATLARMIFVEDSSAKFVSFVRPLKDVLDGIAAASGGGSSAVALRQNVPEDTVIGLFRDLHGIAQATLSRRAYMCGSSSLPTSPSVSRAALCLCAIPVPSGRDSSVLFCELRKRHHAITMHLGALPFRAVNFMLNCARCLAPRHRMHVHMARLAASFLV